MKHQKINQKRLLFFVLIKKEASFPNYGQKMKLDLHISKDDLKKAFFLPHSVVFEPFVKAFQFNVLKVARLDFLRGIPPKFEH